MTKSFFAVPKCFEIYRPKFLMFFFIVTFYKLDLSFQEHNLVLTTLALSEFSNVDTVDCGLMDRRFNLI